MAAVNRRGGCLARGHGVGYRRELAAELLVQPGSVGFVEVVAESCFVDEGTRREAIALAEVWPVIPHGVKLSLGSASGIDTDKAARLGALARQLRAPVITEHVALTATPGHEIGHLTPVPRSEALIRVVAKNVARAQRALPDVPLLLENIAVPFGFADDAMPEADLYGRITEVTGCDLLLDVANLYANAVNAGVDPVAMALSFPLDRVGMIHLAGGIFEDGFYFDTHAHPVPDAVFEVLAAVLGAVPDVPIVLERDAHFDDGLSPLLQELERARALRPDTRNEQLRARSAVSPRSPESADEQLSLIRDQAALAALLLERAPPVGAFAESIGIAALDRARGILERKRVEDALPALPRLSRRAAEVWPIAERALNGRTRAPRMQGIADALAIADAVIAEARAAMADDARRDRLLLVTRFATQRGTPSPRVAPFVARERLSNDSVVWAIKGFGASAPIRVHERGRGREQRTT